MKVQVTANEIVVGETKFTRYIKFETARDLAGSLGIPSTGHPKEFNARFTAAVECTPSKFLKLANALMYKVFVAKYSDKLVKNFALSEYRPWKRSAISSARLVKLESAADKLQQAMGDGLWNITPFIYHLNKSPKELKEMFGKGLWSSLCKNSFTRNKLICAFGESRATNNVSTIKELNLVSSTLLRKFPSTYYEVPYVLKHLSFSRKGEYAKVTDNDFLFVLETKRMADQLGEVFNPQWSKRKMHEKHEQFSRDITARDYSDEPFSFVQDLPNSFSTEEFTCKLLDSKFKIALEGKEMHHCVASYADRSSRGEYLVYAVMQGDEKYSTIGFTRDKATGKVRIQQHYKRFNANVDHQGAKDIALLLESEINNQGENPAR